MSDPVVSSKDLKILFNEFIEADSEVRRIQDEILTGSSRFMLAAKHRDWTWEQYRKARDESQHHP